MAQDPNEKHSKVFLLVAGSTSSPKNVKIVDKSRSSSGSYLQGISQDLANMEQYLIGNRDIVHLHNVVRDMANLSKNTVLLNIRQAIEKCNGSLTIYYTGHGESYSGNWCFADGVITLKDIIDVIIKYDKRNTAYYLLCDCCFSGNWCEELEGYKNLKKRIKIYAACHPNTIAIDTENGGKWTLWWLNQIKQTGNNKNTNSNIDDKTNNSNEKSKSIDTIKNDLKHCESLINSNKVYYMSLFKGNQKLDV